jgi:hypothetical protein
LMGPPGKTRGGTLGLSQWALLMLVACSACSAERYARPAGPAPRYEPAPLVPWADAGAQSTDTSHDSVEDEIDRAMAADAGRPEPPRR